MLAIKKESAWKFSTSGTGGIGIEFVALEGASSTWTIQALDAHVADVGKPRSRDAFVVVAPADRLDEALPWPLSCSQGNLSACLPFVTFMLPHV